MNVDQQQVMTVAKILEAAEGVAQQEALPPPLTAAGLAIATGSYAGLHNVDLEEVLDVVARAYNGTRQGLANAQAGTGDVAAGVAPELVTEAPAELVTEAPAELVTEAPAELVTEAPTEVPRKNGKAKKAGRKNGGSS